MVAVMWSTAIWWLLRRIVSVLSILYKGRVLYTEYSAQYVGGVRDHSDLHSCFRHFPLPAPADAPCQPLTARHQQQARGNYLTVYWLVSRSTCWSCARWLASCTCWLKPCPASSTRICNPLTRRRAKPSGPSFARSWCSTAARMCSSISGWLCMHTSNNSTL